MNWDWDNHFDQVLDFEKFVFYVENKMNFKTSNLEINYLEEKTVPNDLIYSPWSYCFYELIFNQTEKISIDRKFLLLFLEDYQNKKAFKSTNSKLIYISYEFMLNLYLARETSSGYTFYKTKLKELLDLAINDGINIEGKAGISSKEELENYLKNELPSGKSNIK